MLGAIICVRGSTKEQTENLCLPLKEATGVDHHGHEELALPFGETEAAQAFTRASVTLS